MRQSPPKLKSTIPAPFAKRATQLVVNFNGGVDPSALNQTEERRQPEEDSKSLLGTIKDKITGDDAKETPADMKTQKNPTLERYPKSLD